MMADYHRIMNSLARCQAAYDNMEPEDGPEENEENEPDYEPDDWGDEAADFGGMDNGY